MKKPISYELTTINDIFDKVPTDRIELCCQELGLMLVQSKLVREAAIAIEPDAAKGLTLDPTLTWIDDGEGTLTSVIRVDGDDKPLAAIKTTISSREVEIS